MSEIERLCVEIEVSEFCEQWTELPEDCRAVPGLIKNYMAVLRRAVALAWPQAAVSVRGIDLAGTRARIGERTSDNLKRDVASLIREVPWQHESYWIAPLDESQIESDAWLALSMADICEHVRVRIDGNEGGFTGRDWSAAWGAACAAALSLAGRLGRDVKIEELAPDGTRTDGAKAVAEPRGLGCPARIVSRR